MYLGCDFGNTSYRALTRTCTSLDFAFISPFDYSLYWIIPCTAQICMARARKHLNSLLFVLCLEYFTILCSISPTTLPPDLDTFTPTVRTLQLYAVKQCSIDVLSLITIWMGNLGILLCALIWFDVFLFFLISNCCGCQCCCCCCCYCFAYCFCSLANDTMHKTNWIF